MPLITSKTVTMYQILLTEDEAQSALADPWELREQLYPVVNPNGKGHRAAPVPQLESGKVARKPRRGKGISINAASAERYKKNGATAKTGPKEKKRLTCPHCPKTFQSPIWLNNHVQREHTVAGAE